MKSVKKITNYLYTASLFFLIFLTAVCVAISAADVIIQALTDKTSTGEFDYRNLIVVGGSYVLLALASLLFSCSRLLTVRGSLQDIPKLYIPIKKEDLPKKVFIRIRDQFEKTKETRKLAEPRSEDIQAEGWAKPGTHLFEGLDFKLAVARTPAIVEKVAKSIRPEYARPMSVPVRQYVEFLMQQGVVDKQLGTVYLQGYELARFSNTPLSQEQYMNIMKHLAAILQSMGYNIKNNSSSASRKQGSTSSICSRQQITTGSSSESHKSSTKRPGTHRQGTASSAGSSRRSIRSHEDNASCRTWKSHTSTHSSNQHHQRHTAITPSINSMHRQESGGSSSSVMDNASHEEEKEEEKDDMEVDSMTSDEYLMYDEEEVMHDIYELLMKEGGSSS